MTRGLFLLLAIWAGLLAFVGLAEVSRPRGWASLLVFAVGAGVAVLVREGLESSARTMRRRPVRR